MKTGKIGFNLHIKNRLHWANMNLIFSTTFSFNPNMKFHQIHVKTLDAYHCLQHTEHFRTEWEQRQK